MRVEVEFHDERLGFDVADDRLVGLWQGPTRLGDPEVRALAADSLERPLEFPALRLAIVPGDRVVIPIEPDLPEPAIPVLVALCSTLQSAGVEPSSIRIVTAGPVPEPIRGALPRDVVWTRHDPDDSSQIAYLANTAGGRRIYLNRHLTDADFVVPIGQLGYDPVLGYRGPWSILYPGLTNAEGLRASNGKATESPPDRDQPSLALTESAEVSWLLGCQFHVAILAGMSGLAGILAGQESAVRREGVAALDRAWTFRAERRAELVVAGIGQAGRPTSIDDLASGLTTASRLVRRGGKIVALSRAEGSPGPALQRLIGTREPRPSLAALRGLEGEPDYAAARQLIQTLAWADLYVLSALDDDLVDDLAMTPLGRPEEARRLVSVSDSCLFVSQADRTRARSLDDTED